MTGATLKALNPVIANLQREAGLKSQPGNYSNFTQWQIGLTFQVPIGMRAPLANTRSAQYALLRARAYMQQIVHQTTHSLARFFLEIDANYKQFKTASRLRAAAALRLESQRAYYEEGRITIDRFLDAVSQYATAVATEAQYKTTYNISIVALEEAKGTLLAYDNIAVAEGPHPAKAYTQARDIQDAHRRFPIRPDGPEVPQRQVGPLNPDPVDPQAPPGVEAPEGPPLPGPSGPLGPRPSPLPPYSPARILPTLSQTQPGAGARAGAGAGAAAVQPPQGPGSAADVRLTGGPTGSAATARTASLIDPTVPGMGRSSVAESLGRPSITPNPGGGSLANPVRTQTAPPQATTPAPGTGSRGAPAAEDLPELPPIELPPLPPPD